MKKPNKSRIAIGISFVILPQLPSHALPRDRLVGGQKLFQMTTTLSWLFIIASALMGTTFSIRGEDLLFHTGPPVSTPASSPITPAPDEGPLKFIEFQREFFIAKDLLASLPEPSAKFGSVAVSAVEAISLAKKNIDPDGNLRTLIVTDVRLLTGPENGARQVEYYLISTLANGSEVHRIVVMNGRVLSSKLRKIKE